MCTIHLVMLHIDRIVFVYFFQVVAIITVVNMHKGVLEMYASVKNILSLRTKQHQHSLNFDTWHTVKEV